MQGGNNIAKTSVRKQEKIKQAREHINNRDRRADGVRPPAGAPVRHDRARCGAAGGGGGAWHRGGSGRAAGVQRGACAAHGAGGCGANRRGPSCARPECPRGGEKGNQGKK